MDASSGTNPEGGKPDAGGTENKAIDDPVTEAASDKQASATSKADGRDGDHATTALAAIDPAPAVDLFVARPEGKTETTPPRGLKTRILDYSAHAAMIVGLLGFAWTVGDHVVNRPSSRAIDIPAKQADATASLPKKSDELADLRGANRDLAADVRQLRTRLDSLQAKLRDDKTSARLSVMQAGLDDVKTGLATARSETAQKSAQLNGRIDKIGHESDPKVQQMSERLGRLEHQTVDASPTASLPPRASDKKSVDLTGGEPKAGKSKVAAAEETRKAEVDGAQPKILAGWVVRDVYDGVALIESRRGPLEVVPGVSVPGAGVVKSIDRHGSGWTVTTTKGLVAFAGASHDYRRTSARDSSRGYGYDF